MTRTKFLVTVAMAVAVLARGGFAQEKAEEANEGKRLAEATTVFTEIMGAEDKAVPESILGKAEGIAIFPSTIY